MRKTEQMLLTVSTTHTPATDLGYLLHKHPDRVQEFEQSFGTARVFYPQAEAERCTAALLLEVDPVRLARSRPRGAADFSLAQYVNDRSYAASSLLAVALGKVFSTARSGRCDARQKLADSAIPLEINIPVLPSHGGSELTRRLFAPLGWEVGATAIPLDEQFRWGDSRYLHLQLTGRVRLADALNQLYLLLPVLDESKHYWQGDDEVDKLIRSGSTWLAGHPEAELITRSYLPRYTGLAEAGLARLAELSEDVPEHADRIEDAEATDAVGGSEDTTPVPTAPPLNRQRADAVHQLLTELGARTVIDLGCGSGQLLRQLLPDAQFTRLTGCDVSTRALQGAYRRLGGDEMSERQEERVQLFQASLTYEDDRFAGYDAAVLMEVIEHVDPARLATLERIVFGQAVPGAVVLTTPNSEYNARYQLAGMRHHDHRFEWSRRQLATWSARVAERYRYRVRHRGIGPEDAQVGSPTQVAIFTREADQ